MDTTDRIRLLAVLVHEHARNIQVHTHLDTPGAYADMIAGRDIDEGSAHDEVEDYWHRWARFEADGVKYVVHDPTRYEADPLDSAVRVAELMDMMGRVVLAADMGAAEKVRELTRLSARMREIAPASYVDGTTDATTEAIDVVADALAGAGDEA